MRLTQIKLSGFKSFAEPTTLQLPGQLVGVVGPNGCGKSNLIDAVRWVLGESRASELRGESMQDVIFNGSGQRKPAQRASVELVFDNAQARAGGQWNAFAEIAVRRTLTRDGTSSYYINQHAVRRRDVQDVFLGTGLGPRAYAIIGQGTISRIIESRPEELRLFLEEAAGVSKYKERRRETENRLRDTRENLNRVEDILRELDAQLARLAQQAEVAERWRGLQDEAQLRQHQLWFLKHRDAAADEARAAAAATAEATALEARIAELRAAESRLERLREAHHAANDELHGAQGVLAEAALVVSRLEERIRYVVQGRARVQTRLAEIEAQDRQWDTRVADADAELASIDDGIAQADDEGAQLQVGAEEAGAALPAAEAALRTARDEAQRQRGEVGRVQQQIQLLAAEGRHLDEQQRQSGARRERLQAEQRTLRPVDAERLQALQAQDGEAAQAAAQADARQQEIGDEAPRRDEARRQAQSAAAQAAAMATGTAARRDALRALQARVQSGGKLAPWLQRQGLDKLPGLWTQVQVEPGWEAAFEAALRERLHALVVGRLETVRAFAGDVPPARLAFYDGAAGAAAPQPPAPAHGLPALAARLRSGDASLALLLQGWLAGCHTADSLDDALAVRDRLAAGENVFTREGHAVAAQSVAFYAPDAEQAGMLARAQEIEQLDRQWRAQQQLADDARAQAVRAEAAHSELVQQLQGLRRDAAAAQTRAHAVHVEWLRLSQQAASAAQRQGQLVGELGDIEAHERDLQARRDAAQARFDELDQALAVAQEAHAGRDDAVTAAEREVAQRRERLRELERGAQEAQFQARALAARRDELRRVLDTAAVQRAANGEAVRQLHDEAAAFDDAAADAGLQAALAARGDAEQVLALARSRYDDLVAQLRQGDEARLAIERGLEPQRARITQLQLALQAAQLGGEQFGGQLDAAGVDRAALAQGIDEGRVRLGGLQAEIDRLRAAIETLGAVNLAALEELETGRERGEFLRAQDADLRDAIATLEGAIQAIDAETRGLLSQTFEQVNDHFGQLFPQLFGGGQARLAMTGTEVLDAGVQVMAQPPGKKNSTIHLLSGGEKALTAIALVFAIFQLNPAPFCLLDEVDAPLDDANTERYRALVEQMSAGTQFLFISHNKIAMEMAGQLIGVTMQEQGVSRIVAVDLGEAIGMADDGSAAGRRGRGVDAAPGRPASGASSAADAAREPASAAQPTAA